MTNLCPDKYRKIVGTEYEYYVLNKIRQDYDKVWHWQEFPEKLMYENKLINDYQNFCKYRYDIGADLVAMKDGKYYFIQCKNFNDSTVYIDTLAGFYFLLYEYNLNGILYYNGTLSTRLLELSTGKVPFINLSFNNENINIEQMPTKIIEPRDYQLEAYNKLKNKSNAILNMPCGTGKTYVASLLGKKYETIIILSPLRFLAYQNLNRFKEYYRNKFSYILVSTDGTRDVNKIMASIKKRNVISSTYDSCDIIIKILDRLKNIYIIVDEYHNLSHNNINDNNNDINKLINSCHNKIFMSATPLEKFIDIPIENIYKYGWDDAIKKKHICDFNVYIPHHAPFEEGYMINNLLHLLNGNYNEKDIKLIKKAYYILKSMLMNGNKKCICYLTTIEKAQKFSEYLDWISKMLNIKLDCAQIDCNIKKLKRKEIIDNFVNAINMAIIINVHILDEGIDIIECDSVYITQPNNNIINIVQRMSRANRITNSKCECSVYLWTTEKKREKIIKHICYEMHGYIKNKVEINNVNNNTINKYEMNNILLRGQIECKMIDSEFVDVISHLIKIDNDYIKFTLDKLGNPWFCAMDVLKILEYKSIKHMIKKNIDKENKMQIVEINNDYKNIFGNNIHPHTIFANKFGLQELISRSSMDKAKYFRKIMLFEILPAIIQIG
jgi:superfamily II DNA or RNA helicase